MLSASARAACARCVQPSGGASPRLRARRAPCVAPVHRRMASAPSCAMGSASSVPEGLSDGCKGAPVAPGAKLPLMGDESIMRPKAHGTCDKAVPSTVRWGCDPKLADRICWCVKRLGTACGRACRVSFFSAARVLCPQRKAACGPACVACAC